MSLNARFQFVHGSGREVFAALYPFILVGAILPLVNILAQSGILPVPNPVVNVVLFTLVCLMGLLLLSGLVLGLPRWSLPYLSLLLALLNLYLFLGGLERPIYNLYSDFFNPASLFGNIFLTQDIADIEPELIYCKKLLHPEAI